MISSQSVDQGVTMGTKYLIGLDLGREVDYTAWAVIEAREYHWHKGIKEYVIDPEGYADSIIEFHNTRRELGLIGLSQIPLHTPWETVAKELDGLIAKCQSRERDASIELWVDATGIGAPILDGFIQPVVWAHSNAVLYPVKITSGDAGYHYQVGTVSKVHLVDTAMVLREQGDLKIAKELEGTRIMELFEQQIQDFRRKQGKRAGTLIYEADTLHDDLVVAFCLACLGLDDSNVPRARLL